MYVRLKGNSPTKHEIKQLAVDLNLRPTKIFKWFWDHKKKLDEFKPLGKSINVDGQTGKGDKLSAVQIKTALKINKISI